MLLVEEKREWSFWEWINHFMKDDQAYYGAEEDDADLTDPVPEHISGTEDVYGDLIDDGILESLLIVGLAAFLAGLVYMHQQRQLNRARQAQNGQGQAGNNDNNQAEQPPPAPPDRGLFPQPGDPDFGQWVAGGVAH